ncbi:MAG: PTS sugar transporter subunit IIA [Candidatus Cloacimonetes bacterium]|nr:PTS sugar transporter subunit IIA [Candidatus Cloacimonadota bacterium]
MYLASYLEPHDICIETKFTNKHEVYAHLVEKICHFHKLPIADNRILEMVISREEESTTAFPSGLAIPHIRLEGFQDTVIAMCFLKNPIDFGGQQISWVTLIITNKTSSKVYLNIVAALLKLSKNNEAMMAIHSLPDGHAVFNYIKKMGVEIKKDICIADIMITNPITINPDALLSELAVIMHGKDVSMVPVTDAANNYLGEVCILDFLKVGVPDYLMMLDNLNFVSTFEPLEHLFEKQDVMKVKEIMKSDKLVLKPETSIIETVFEMMQHRERHLSVVDKGKLVGVVSAMDVFKKVIRA